MNNKIKEFLAQNKFVLAISLPITILCLLLIVKLFGLKSIGYEGIITAPVGGIQNVSEDTSPTLGGSLDGGNFDITGIINLSATKVASTYSSSTAGDFVNYVSSTRGNFNLLTMFGNILPNTNNTRNLGAFGTAFASMFASGTVWATGELVIPDTANPTLDKTGEIANENTTASTSFRVNIGGTEYALFPDMEPSFTITTTTLDSIAGQTASSTIAMGFASIHGETWSRAVCKTTNGTAELEFGDGTNYMNYIKLTTSPSVTVLSANNTFVMDEARDVRVGRVSSTGMVTCTVKILRNAD